MSSLSNNNKSATGTTTPTNTTPSPTSIAALTPTAPNTTSCIHTTMNYSMFKALKGNRLVNLKSAGAKNLIPSIMQSKGNICPIMVTPLFEVLDGQHRLAACKKAKQPVSYIVVPSHLQHNFSNQQVMITLNTANHAWKLHDHMNYHATYNDNAQYGILLSIFSNNNNIIKTKKNGGNNKNILTLLSIITLAGLKQEDAITGVTLVLPEDLKTRIKNQKDIMVAYKTIIGAKMNPTMIARAMMKLISVRPSIDFIKVINGLASTLTVNPLNKVDAVANTFIVAHNSLSTSTNQLALV